MLKGKKIVSGFLALTLIFPFSKSLNKNQYELKRATSRYQLLSMLKKKLKYNNLKTSGIMYSTQQRMESAKNDMDYSNTNVQVDGVDEADIIKTDGKYIYLISTNKNQLNIFEATERPKKIYTLDANKLLNQQEPKEFKGYTKNIYK